MVKISGPISVASQSTTQAPFQRFKSNPAAFLTRYLYARSPRTTTSPSKSGYRAIKVVCTSDTHNATPEIPDGDVLLHAGDLTNKGTLAEVQAQLDWLNSLPHAHKIITAGNHDRVLDISFVEEQPTHIAATSGIAADVKWGDVTFLNDSSTTITVRGREITIFGSPMTPYCGTFGFQHVPIRDVWKDKVPARTDILVTHGPPKGHLDLEGKGCEWLSREISRKKPRLVVFGHIHQGRGVEEISWDHIQRVYDGVCVGDKGLLSVFGMAIVLVVQLILVRLGWRKGTQTTLVNAAVISDENDEKRGAATVIEI